MTNIKMLYNISQEIKSTSGKLAKESILKREINNDELKKFLKFVFDPSLVFGLQEKKLQKFLSSKTDDTTINPATDLFQVFEYLAVNNTGRDANAIYVSDFINSQPEIYHEFLIESITKSLKLGVEKTIVKVFPDIIEKFEVMRGKSYSDYKDKIKGKQFVLAEKKNGIRCITEKRGNVIINKTRQNKIITGLNGINEEIKLLDDGIYDGELVIKESWRYKLRDVLQKTMKIVNSDTDDKIVDYWIFDVLTPDEFNERITSRKYFERRDNSPVNNHNFEYVKMIPELYRGNDLAVVDTLLDEMVDKGCEGLMMNFDLPFKTNKTNNILKVKKKYSSDCRVIGFEEGKGKNKGRLGALILDYKGFPLGCSGMTDELRDEIWQNQDRYLGVIAEITHEQESSNEKGGLSLEYPSFEMWRYDKDEVSYAH